MGELNLDTDSYSFNHNKASDDEILQSLNNKDFKIIVAFVSPHTDIPHTCPVWAIFHYGRIYFQTDSTTTKINYINKENNKLSVSITDPSQFTDFAPNSIIYIGIDGSATIHKKREYAEFKRMIERIFEKYIQDEKEIKKLTNEVMNIREDRVIISIMSEWVKVAKT